MGLTKAELKKFSLKRVIFGYLEQFNASSTLQAESRLIRLQMELKRSAKIKPRDYSYHHASALGIGGVKPEKCLRRLAYSVALQRPTRVPWDALFLNKFETGHDAHAKYQGWLTCIYADKFSSEVPFRNDELNLGGTCDGILKVEIAGQIWRIGVEIKTASESVITQLKRPSGKPYNTYLDQAATYVHNLDLDGVIILYEAKNNQQLLEFPYTAEDLADRWERIEKRVIEINDHLERGTWPRRDRSSDCNLCTFKAECKPNQVRAVNRSSLQPRIKEVIGRNRKK